MNPEKNPPLVLRAGLPIVYVLGWFSGKGSEILSAIKNQGMSPDRSGDLANFLIFVAVSVGVLMYINNQMSKFLGEKSAAERWQQAQANEEKK